MHHAYQAAAYFFAIIMLVLIGAAVVAFDGASQKSACGDAQKEAELALGPSGLQQRKSCGVLVTEGVLMSVAAAVALAALVACSMRAAQHDLGISKSASLSPKMMA